MYLYKYVYIFKYVYRIYTYSILFTYVHIYITTYFPTLTLVANHDISGYFSFGGGQRSLWRLETCVAAGRRLGNQDVCLCWFGNWFQILSLCSISCLRGAGCRILEQTQKTVFQDLGMWAMSSSSLLRRGDFSFASAAAILHQDCELDATTVLPGRHDDQ